MLDHTHDPARRSFVEAANEPDADFPIQNLPLGVFSTSGGRRRIGMAIGDQVLDLSGIAEAALVDGLAAEAISATGPDLGKLFEMGRPALAAVRASLSGLLADEQSRADDVAAHLVPMTWAEMHLPVVVTGFTDMCVSTFHIGRGRGQDEHGQPICPPMFRTIPVGYDGRASSVVVSGSPVRRPWGTWQEGSDPNRPEFGPEPRLDYELELGIWIGGVANPRGQTLSVSRAAERVVGFSLLNDWSARGIQFWEAMLGPFLGKSIATTVSPWVVTAEAMEPFRTAAFTRPPSDPRVPDHLSDVDDQCAGGLELGMEAWLVTAGGGEARLCRTNFSHMYWTPAQMVAHHASNGCSLAVGDLVGSGTCSGPEREAAGCLLESSLAGPLTLSDGSARRWLEDGDTVILRARAEREGFRSIGFGEARGTVLPAFSS